MAVGVVGVAVVVAVVAVPLLLLLSLLRLLMRGGNILFECVVNIILWPVWKFRE